MSENFESRVRRAKTTATSNNGSFATKTNVESDGALAPETPESRTCPSCKDDFGDPLTVPYAPYCTNCGRDLDEVMTAEQRADLAAEMLADLDPVEFEHAHKRRIMRDVRERNWSPADLSDLADGLKAAGAQDVTICEPHDFDDLDYAEVKPDDVEYAMTEFTLAGHRFRMMGREYKYGDGANKQVYVAATKAERRSNRIYGTRYLRTEYSDNRNVFDDCSGASAVREAAELVHAAARNDVFDTGRLQTESGQVQLLAATTFRDGSMRFAYDGGPARRAYEMDADGQIRISTDYGMTWKKATASQRAALNRRVGSDVTTFPAQVRQAWIEADAALRAAGYDGPLPEGIPVDLGALLDEN